MEKMLYIHLYEEELEKLEKIKDYMDKDNRLISNTEAIAFAIEHFVPPKKEGLSLVFPASAKDMHL